MLIYHLISFILKSYLNFRNEKKIASLLIPSKLKLNSQKQFFNIRLFLPKKQKMKNYTNNTTFFFYISDINYRAI